MEYDSRGNDLDRLARESKDLQAALNQAAHKGAAFWNVKSIKDTTHNSKAVLPWVTRDEHGRLMGQVYAWGHYARYREHGTRWNAAERVLRKAIKVIEAGP